MTKAQTTERDDAIAKLREWLQPGDTVYTILRHVSRSGMQREIGILIPLLGGTAIESVPPGGKPTDYVRKDSIGVDFRHLTYAVAEAIGLRTNKVGDGVIIGGCGMDMGFEIVYTLGRALWPEGYHCAGAHCQSNDHTNDRTCRREAGTHLHRDGGYALQQRWL